MSSSSDYNSEDHSDGDTNETSASESEPYLSEDKTDDDKSEEDEQIDEDDDYAVHPDEIEAIDRVHQEIPVDLELDVDEIQKKKYRRIPKSERIDHGHKLPPVSSSHLEIVDRLKEDNEIRTPEVYELMKSVDFTWFYKNFGDEWPMTNARMLESAITVLKTGHDVLSLPLNMYFNVCCALIVGHQGSVLCFGHSVNINMLKMNGLDWLEKEDRLRFSYEDLNMSYGYTYSEFLELGFPYRAPYDVILLAASSEPVVTNEVANQLRPGGICYQPSSNTFISTPGHDDYDAETEMDTTLEDEKDTKSDVSAIAPHQQMIN